jgi:serine/threonine-protein kinase
VSLIAGAVLGERYRLISKIAAGGMGEVWRAEDILLGRPVALKAMHPGLTGDPGFAERFRAEARNTARLSHPGIANVYDYGEAIDPSGGSRAYLIMQLVDGEPLSALIDADALDSQQTMDILAQAAMALGAAHRAGVVHRDVKPGNLLVRPDGSVVVTDFGIARTVDSAGMTATGQVLGTAAYISPEQAEGKPATPLSDIYSLGVVGYQCLAGRRPFEGENPITVAMAHLREEPPPLSEDIPVTARAVIERSMAREPELRFPTAESMAEAARGAVAAPWDDRLAAATTQMLAANRTAMLGGATAGGLAAGGLAGAGAAAAFRGSAAPAQPAGHQDPYGYPGTEDDGYSQPRYDDGYAGSGYAAAGGPYDGGGPGSGYDARRTGKDGAGGRGRKVGLALIGVVVALAAVIGGIVLATWLSSGRGTQQAGPGNNSPGVASTSSEPSPSASSDSPSPSPSASKSSAPVTVTVNPDDYLNNDFATVARQLRNKGLQVQRVNVTPTKPGDKAGIVTAVEPSGDVVKGSLIKVSAFRSDYEAPASSSSPSSSASSSPSASASASASAATAVAQSAQRGGILPSDLLAAGRD